MKYFGEIVNDKDLVTKEYVDRLEELPYPYQEVEWVESNGRQYVYLNWKPPINTWGFEADFLCRNAFNTTGSAWNASTNVNGYGHIFGTQNSDLNNNIGISTYSSTGSVKIGAAAISNHGLKTDKTRQTMSLRGTILTKPDGTTLTVTRANEVVNKPYANMTVFATHSGLRRSGTGNVVSPSTTRIYSLKFYDGDILQVNLVGAIRTKDGMTGLYDKIEKHFYPAPGMTYGDIVDVLGDKETVLDSINQKDVQVVVNNYPNTRMFRATAPQLTKLEDGQQISVTFLYNIGSSTQTTELAGWDDTNSNYNVYLKLTLADDTTTDWIPCYYGLASRLTTHYSSGVPTMFTYRENVLSGGADGTGGTIVLRAFYCEQNYDANTIDRIRESYFRPYAGEAIYRYKFVLQGADHRVYPIVTTNQTDGTQVAKVPTTVGLRPGRIWWYNTTTTKNAGALLDANTLDKVYQTTTSVYNFNTDIAAYRTVYLRGTYNKDTDLFTLYNNGSSPCTSYYTQVPTNTANITLSSYFVSGYYYMLLGASYSSANYVALFAYNPLYYFDGTNLVPASTKVAQDLSSASVSGKIDTAGTGLSKSGTTLNHSNSVTAQTTQAIYPIKIDAQGHISAYGTSPTTLSGYGITDAKIASGTITLGSNTITPLTSSSTLNAAKLSGAIPSAVTATTQTAGDNSTKIATTAFVSSAISTLGSVLNYKGTKATVSALPTSGNTTGDVWHVTANSGEYAWDGTEWQELGTAISIPANTGNSTTGISIAAHGTGTVIGVQSSTTTVRGVKTGTDSLVTASHVTGGGNGTAPTLGTAISLIGVQSSTTSVRGVKTGTNSTTTASKVTLGTAFSIPNPSATDVTVPIRADADITVPVAASAATTVPIKATSATTVPIRNISATAIPNVTAVGSGDASLTFAMDTTDTKKLKITFSHTHIPPTLGTAISLFGVQANTTSVIGVQSSTTSVTGVSGSTTVRGVKTGTNSTTTASKVSFGTAFSVPNVTGATDITVPIRADADTTVPIKNVSATSIPNVTSAGTASTWTFEDVNVPIRADADTIVPIKNASASTFVTGTTHTVTDNGHTHTI